MSFTDLIWIFFLFTALQPLFRKKLVETLRTRKMAQFEKKRGSRVILLVHRQETMSFLGFPVMRYIDVHDSEEVLRAVHLTDPEVPLDLVLHTPGRIGPGGGADRARDPRPQGQGHGVRAALRHVGRHLDRARRRRDRDVHAFGAGPDRSATGPVARRLALESGRAEADRRDRRQHAHPGGCRARRRSRR